MKRDVPTLIHDGEAWVRAEHYDAKRAEVEWLRGALRFYADEETYDSGPHTRANADGGRVAREALARQTGTSTPGRG